MQKEEKREYNYDHIILNRSRVITSTDIWQRRLGNDELSVLYHIFLQISRCNYIFLYK